MTDALDYVGEIDATLQEINGLNPERARLKFVFSNDAFDQESLSVEVPIERARELASNIYKPGAFRVVVSLNAESENGGPK